MSLGNVTVRNALPFSSTLAATTATFQVFLPPGFVYGVALAKSNASNSAVAFSAQFGLGDTADTPIDLLCWFRPNDGVV